MVMVVLHGLQMYVFIHSGRKGFAWFNEKVVGLATEKVTEKMRILIINHYAGGPDLGMEHRPWYLAREWQRMGHEVLIVSASFAHTRSQQPPAALTGSVTEVSGVPVLYLSTPSYHGNGLRRVINIVTFLRRLHRRAGEIARGFRPEVVIASSTYPPDIFPARRIARRSGARLVWEVHDLWPLSPMEMGGFSKWHPFVVWLQRGENHACRHAHKVVSLLPCTSEHLEQHGMDPGKFVHVPNGILPEEWDTGAILPEEHQQEINRMKGEGRLLIAYTGALGVANALTPLLEAAAMLQHLPVGWIIVGHGPEKEALQLKAASLGLNNLVFCPTVPKKVLPALLSRMDILYIGLHKHPLFRFGVSPNKLFDYMMAGKPVIQAIEAGNDPVGEAGCGITIPADNPAAIAGAVNKLAAASPEERKKMGDAGREYVLQNHSYPVLAKRFLDAIR